MASACPLKYITKLQGARVLIIGGTSGIGFGVAEALIEHQAHVFVASSSAERVATAVQRLHHAYPSSRSHIEGLTCNLGHRDEMVSQVEGLFAHILKTGKLNHVVFTAGDGFALGRLEDFTVAEMEDAGMVRFFGPLVVAQQLSRAMEPSTASSLTLTTGGLNQRPRKGWVVMMSYLAGLEGMTRALARDLAPIRVNIVGPGPTETERWNTHQETSDVDALRSKLATATVTQHLGQVEDVAESYIYLMKDKNVSGSVVYTNGGGLLV